MIKKIQENLIKSDIKPLFADDVVVVTPVKAIKEGNKLKKEGHIVFIFVDMLNQQPIAKIVLSKTTAESFKKILTKVLIKLDKDLKSSELPKTIISDQAKTESTKYIG